MAGYYDLRRAGRGAERVGEIAGAMGVIVSVLSLLSLPLWPLYNDYFAPGVPIVTFVLLGCAVISGFIVLISWTIQEIQQGTYFE